MSARLVRKGPRPLTEDEKRKHEADHAARLEGFRKALEAASDSRERARLLGGALRMCGTWQPLPEWLFKALDDDLAASLPQEPDADVMRCMAVVEAKREGRTWQRAYEQASEWLKDTPYHGAPYTMRNAYKDVKRRLKWDRK